MQFTRWSAQILTVTLMLSLLSPISVHGQTKPTKTEELQGGRWIAVDKTAPEATVDPELVRIEELINAGHFKQASSRAVDWLLKNPASPAKDRGLFLNAEALYRYGDRVKSFYYLDQLLDEFPESKLFYPALDKQYQIADDFLPAAGHAAYKSRFLGLAIIGREDEAIEMMYRIQQRSPGSQLAERALLRTADYYYADAQYDLAGDAYAAYARSYPRSPLLPQVKLRSAKSLSIPVVPSPFPYIV